MDTLDQVIYKLQLPPVFRTTVTSYYIPLLERLAQWRSERPDKPLIVGVSGAQGTGKSTLGHIIKSLLHVDHGLKVARLSIDDFYYRLTERQKLAKDIHPLLLTRGVPGTHDIELIGHVIESLMNAEDDTVTHIPRFDKGVDDRAPRAAWPSFIGKPDIIVFEGWVVGTPPQDEEALITPVNQLEAEEDPDGSWRRYVNLQLAGPYQTLFKKLDRLVMLCAPHMEAVLQWRREEEWKMARDRAALNLPAPPLMDDADMLRFVRHYERLTMHALEVVPSQADVAIFWNEHHNVDRAEYRKDD